MYWVTILVLLIYLVLAWVLGIFLPLHGMDVWILRGVLALLGLIGAAVVLWFQHKIKKAKETSGDASEPGSTGDLDSVVRDAVRRLKQSTRGSDLASLPLVLLLGDSGSTKTTVLINSALDPELLAGQVYRDSDILPTSVANIWYTRQAIFVDPAGSMMGQSERWRRLVKLLQPARFSAAIGKRAQSPRAAVVCFDCENFLQPNASEAVVSAARKLSARLQEISRQLGINFPVYVLFTKVDRIAFFNEFVRGMSKAEVSEVLGATLPLRSLSSGVYADEEMRRLTKVFDEIFYSLAERRILLLPREHEADKLPGIYEFPREIRKLRTLLVQFLVDLARPSQLGTNPFLRGFYFTGVRPVVVDDVIAAPALPVAAEAGMDAGATQIFRGVGSHVAQAVAPPRSIGSRRVPQWVFLTSLFNDILVKDRVALATSGASSRVNLLRRFVLGAAVLAVVICLAGFLISFLRNRALETQVHDTITDLSKPKTGPNQVAVVDDLRKLDELRQELVTLADYEQNVRPWSMRGGRYGGDQVYRDAKPVYFNRFRQLLFAETQKRVTDTLLGLYGKTAVNAPNDAYQKTYDELKEYLITTEPVDHDKSTKEFMTPVLMSHWVDTRDIDKERRDLAGLQFDFYSTELAKENPFPTGNSKDLIQDTRAYLLQFTGIDRFYALLLNNASQANHDVSFNDQFSNASGVVVSNHKVRGAFTRGGFLYVQEAIKNPQRYLNGEKWVVGEQDADKMDQSLLQKSLSDRYNQDFVNEWNTVLKSSSVAGYASYGDADKKLEKLTGPTSPLMELMYFVSHNTTVAPADLKAPFAPVEAVEPPGPADKAPDHYIEKTEDDYIKALGNLQADFHKIAQSTGAPDPAVLNQAATDAGAARLAVTSIITSVPVDAKFGNEAQVRRLLEEPIASAEALTRRGPADIANAGGKGYCSQFAVLANKYPFDPGSSQEVSADQLYSIVGPSGDAWKKLNDDVKPFVQKVGSKYEANPQASVQPSKSFLLFLNRIEALGEVLYPGGATTPHFSYTLKQMPSNLEGVVLKIGAVSLAGDGAQETFVWTGAPENIDVSKNGDTLDSAAGPWAVFHFVARAHRSGSNNLEWVIENNGKPVMLPNGKIKSYDYQLQVAGAENPFFDLQGMKCVSQVAGK